jgi:hypothetical protein
VGDVLHFGSSPSSGFPEHVDLAVDVGPILDSILTISRVAGGERDGAGHETIAMVSRPLSGTRQMIETRTARPLIGIIRADALAARWGLR